MQYDILLEKTPYDDFETFNEAVYDNFTQGLSQGFQSGKDFAEGDFKKFESRAQYAISKGSEFANYMSKQTGVSPALALAMTMAGITGGASALPMAAVMYFDRKHVNKLLQNPVSKLVDMGFDAFAGKNQNTNQNANQNANQNEPQPNYTPKPFRANKRNKIQPNFKPTFQKEYTPEQLAKRERRRQLIQAFQPKFESMSFKEWLNQFESAVATSGNKENWLDWGARQIGHGIGAVSGAIYGYGKGILNNLGNRIKEIYQFVSGNPRQAVKLASIVGLSMLTGGVVGKLSADAVNAVTHKISSVMGMDPSQVHGAVAQASGTGDFSGGTSSSGDFGGAESQSETNPFLNHGANAAQAKGQAAADLAHIVGKKINFFTARDILLKDIVNKIQSGEVNSYDTLQQAVYDTKKELISRISSTIGKEAFRDIDTSDVNIRILGPGSYSGNAYELTKQAILKAGGTPDESLDRFSQAAKEMGRQMSKPILQDD